MQENIIQAGSISFDLNTLVQWEWSPEEIVLTVRLLDKTLYLHGDQAQAVWMILNTLANEHWLPDEAERRKN